MHAAIYIHVQGMVMIQYHFYLSGLDHTLSPIPLDRDINQDVSLLHL